MLISRRAPAATFPTKRPLAYYITDRKQIVDGSLLSVVRRNMKRGIDFVQIREKDLPDRQLHQLTCRAVELARANECRVLVNGRADIAVAAGAQGVHLPSSGLQPVDLKPWLKNDFLVGISAHSIEDCRRAESQGVDYVLLGPVFPTPSKMPSQPLGLEYLERACAAVSLPVIALGGMRQEMMESVLRAGAAGIAGISLFQKTNENDE